MDKVICYSCNNTLDLVAGSDTPRSEECPKCAADVRCCVMCVFYDTSSYNNCREPSAERVLDSTKANYCGYFKLSGNGESGKEGSDEEKSIMDAANALFKD